ncbi:FIST signal transduction protein [Candidatus Omnitrophota bacterium]
MFTTIHFQGKKLLEGIYSVFGKDTNVLGCTGYGVITKQGVFKYGVAIMAIYSTKIKFSFGSSPEIDKIGPQRSGEQFALSALEQLGKSAKEMSIIFSDGLIEKSSEMLLGIKGTLGRSFPIIGASAADNLLFQKTYQYFNREVLNNALVGTILSGEVTFGYGIKHGWQPLGRPHTVTLSLGNIMREIDGEPAINIYKNYFKKSEQEIKSLLGRISILYPLGVHLIDEEEYLLRNVLRIDAGGGLVCQGEVPLESEVRIMLGTQQSALQAAKQAVEQAMNVFEHTPLLGAIIFESASRINLLGHRVIEELNIIKNALGENVPLIGVCTYGEQAPLQSLEYQGSSHCHNETIAIITLGEKVVFIE